MRFGRNRGDVSPSLKNSANQIKIGTERTCLRRIHRGRACLRRIRMVVEASIKLLKLPPYT